ncbi:MAG: autotransporter domain-containing protein, partial [Reyranella sp.]
PFSVRVAVGNNAVITNTGTLDGTIAADTGTGHLLTNSGLITVSTALTPGGSSVHTINGTFTQTSAGTLALRVLPTATATNFDTLAVTGTANLAGRLRAQVQPGLYGSTTVYAGALTFASSTGSFAGIDSSSIFFNASALYNAGSIDLILSRIPFTAFASGQGGSNAQSVANALEAQYSTSLTGTAAAFYTQLLQSTAPNTLSQLTGEVASTGQNASFGAFNQLFGTVFGQINTSRTAGTSLAQSNGGQRRSLELAEACSGDACQDGTTPGRRMNYWAQGFGAAGNYDANATTGSAQVNVTSGGGATGIDIYVTPNLLVGAMLGTTSAGFALNSLSSTGGSQSLVFGAYGSYTAGAAYLDAALAYGRGSFTTQRYVATGSLTEQVSGAFGGNQYGGRVEGGWTFGLDRVAFTPFGNLTVQALQQDSYSETARNMATGAPGLTGLNVQGQTTTSVRSVLGAEFRAMIELDEATVLRPRARLGWAHEFNTYRASTSTFAALGPGVPFTVQGTSPASDALVVTAAVEVELGRMLRVYAQFDGDFASTARSYAGTGGIKLHW